MHTSRPVWPQSVMPTSTPSSAAFYNATHACIHHGLEGEKPLLRITQRGNTIEYLAIGTFLCAPRSNQVYFFEREICWRLHHPSVLAELQTPGCTVDDRNGTLHTQNDCLTAHYSIHRTRCTSKAHFTMIFPRSAHPQFAVGCLWS